jgi:hypothetical protein
MKVASLSDWLFERLEAPPGSRCRFALARRESLFLSTLVESTVASILLGTYLHAWVSISTLLWMVHIQRLEFVLTQSSRDSCKIRSSIRRDEVLCGTPYILKIHIVSSNDICRVMIQVRGLRPHSLLYARLVPVKEQHEIGNMRKNR